MTVGAVVTSDPPEETALPPQGVRLGVDVGSVRIGVARSDSAGILATPVATLARDEKADSDITRLLDYAAEFAAVEIVVGLPRTLRGTAGHAVAAARAYGAKLQERRPDIPIVFVDERLTSVRANRVLTDRKIRGQARKAVVDQLAAVDILQMRLDQLKAHSNR